MTNDSPHGRLPAVKYHREGIWAGNMGMHADSQ